MQQLEASVIIPHVHGQARLDNVVRSVLDAFSQSAIEIVIVFNGSQSEIPPIRNVQRNTTVRAVRLPENLGFAGGCNKGAKGAKGAFLLFLNDDVIMPKHSGDQLLASARQDSEACAWQPIILRDNAPDADNAGSFFGPFGFLVHNRSKHGSETITQTTITRVFTAHGACLLFKRALFEQESGFEEQFFAYWEETDIQWRLQLQGWKVGVIHNVRVCHTGGATSRVLLSDEELNFLSFRNRMWSLCRNLETRHLLFVMPMHMLVVAIIGILGLISGRKSMGKGIFRALHWIFANSPMILNQRHAIQSRRKVSDEVALEFRVGIGAIVEQLRFFRQYFDSYKETKS